MSFFGPVPVANEFAPCSSGHGVSAYFGAYPTSTRLRPFGGARQKSQLGSDTIRAAMSGPANETMELKRQLEKAASSEVRDRAHVKVKDFTPVENNQR